MRAASPPAPRPRTRPHRGRARIGLTLSLVLLPGPGLLASALQGVGSEPERSAPLRSPDLDPEVAARRDGDSPLAQKFLFVTGSDLYPRDGSDFRYANQGCLRSNATAAVFTIDLQLEDGVEIDFFRLFYYDANASGTVSAFLTEFDGQGGAVDVFSVTSDTDGGYGSVGGPLSHVVGTGASSLSILATTSAPFPDLRICGVRIRYQDAELFRDGFESGDTSRWSSTIG